MFYINYVKGDNIGVVDTTDMVEEVYTYKQVESFVKRNITILPQGAQYYFLDFMSKYFDLVGFVGTSNESVIKPVLDFAEGRVKVLPESFRGCNKEAINSYHVSVNYIRNVYWYSGFGYKSINPMMYKRFKELSDITNEIYNINWKDESCAYSLPDGSVGNTQYDAYVEKLDKAVDAFCRDCKFNRKMVNKWISKSTINLEDIKIYRS